MKSILFAFLIIISPRVFSIEYIQYFYKIKKTKDFDLVKTLKENNCTDMPLQKKIFYNKNKKNNDNKSIVIQSCIQPQKFSDEELNIVEWIDFEVPPKFILSKEIEKNGCSNIYTRQIPHFYLKNNQVPKDVNIFPKGIKVKIQKCNNKALIVEDEFDEKIESNLTTDSLLKTPQEFKTLPAFYIKFSMQDYIYGGGIRKEDTYDSYLLFNKNKINFEIRKSILKKNIFNLNAYAGYSNNDAISQRYLNMGISMKYEKIQVDSILNYKNEYNTLDVKWQAIDNFRLGGIINKNNSTLYVEWDINY